MIERVFKATEPVEEALKIEKVNEIIEIGTPEAVAKLMEKYKDLQREIGCILHLDMNFEVKFVQQIGIGAKQSCNFNIADVFKAAIVRESDAIILVHNHPQERVAKPTSEDTEITRRLRNVGLDAKLPLVDHVVLGTQKFFSYRQKGLIFPQSMIYVEEISSLKVNKTSRSPKGDLMRMIGKVDRDFLMR